MQAYYDTFSELLLPATTDGEGDDSESEEELQSMIQTHRMWAPLHATTEEGADESEDLLHCLGWRRTTSMAGHREE